jgi:hypothetical protein
MDTIMIRVIKTRPSNWFKNRDIYKVNAKSKSFTRPNGDEVLGYFLLPCEENTKVYGSPVSPHMCIGLDSCIVIGGRNAQFKSLLEEENK